MINRLTWKHGLAPVAVVAWFLSSSAKADINWVFQPSQSPVVFSGAIGDVVFNSADGALGSEIDYPNGQPEWIQVYNGVPQAKNQFDPNVQGYTDANGQFHFGVDPNFGSYPGYTNSAQSSASGSFTTVGNNFLNSLNFGAEPVIANFNNFNPTTQFAFSGNYYPDSGGTGTPGIYNNATPSQLGLTFVGASGPNIFANGTAAQQSMYGTVLAPVVGGGPLDAGFGPTGKGDAGTAALTGTGGYASSNGVTVTPTTTGSFDASNIHFSGVLAFSSNFQANNGSNNVAQFTPSSFFDLVNQLANNGTNGLLSISNDLGASAVGQYTRGPGGTYLMAVPYSATMSFGTSNGDINFAGLKGTPDPSRPDPTDPNHLYGSTIGTGVFIDLHFTATFTAQANIATGDANFDGVVNAQDLALVSSNWLTANSAHLGTGDINGDGIVNAQDLALVSSNWLHTTPALPGGGNANSVPEPGTWILLGLGGILLAIRRRLV